MLQRVMVTFLVGLILAGQGFSQTLKQQLNDTFAEVLDLQLSGSPGKHGQHFLPANVASSQALINSLTNFIGTGISSFPLSSSTAGVTFDFSAGKPVQTSTSFGPIYSERAQTLGGGRINMGFNFTYIKFTRMRGISVDDLRMTFTHQDVGLPGLGDSPNEFDTIDLFMNMNINASVMAVYFTYGITDRFDLGIAVPFTNVQLKTTPFARINSFTWVSNDSANHYYGGTQTEPVLTKYPTPINDDATGIGDVAIRAKYNFIREKAVDFAAMLEYRMKTGDADNFLGAGFSTLRATVIGSKILGDFSPHLNLSYWKKFTDNDRDEIEGILGYDQKIANWFTLAIDVLGRFELGNPIASMQFPTSVNTKRVVGSTTYTNTISLTNLPYYHNDNTVDASFGVKLELKEALLLMTNVIVPLNHTGLRADAIPTVGMEFGF
jgi:hypothetical protein